VSPSSVCVKSDSRCRVGSPGRCACPVVMPVISSSSSDGAVDSRSSRRPTIAPTGLAGPPVRVPRTTESGAVTGLEALPFAHVESPTPSNSPVCCIVAHTGAAAWTRQLPRDSGTDVTTAFPCYAPAASAWWHAARVAEQLLKNKVSRSSGDRIVHNMVTHGLAGDVVRSCPRRCRLGPGLAGADKNNHWPQDTEPALPADTVAGD